VSVPRAARTRGFFARTRGFFARTRGFFARTLGLALLAALPSACVPLFVPPVPTDPLQPAPAWRVAGDAALAPVLAVDGRVAGLRLSLRFDEVPASAWVAVQWFGPVGRERASDARWVEPGDAGRTWTWDAPDDLELEPGRWRAVLSVGDLLLRQFDVELPAE